MKIKRKDLEIYLQQLEDLSKPKIKYEQYSTPSRVAANLIWNAGIENNDIYEKNIIDLGCGSGILSLGAAYLGAKNVFGVDIDQEALQIAKRNSINLDYREICHWFCGDIHALSLKDIDTTIMNPPFGMRKESLSRDREFLLTALSFSKIIYSINPHSEKTRKFFDELCKNNKAKISSIIKMDFDIKHSFEFHRKTRHIFQIDLYRIINHETYLNQ